MTTHEATVGLSRAPAANTTRITWFNGAVNRPATVIENDNDGLLTVVFDDEPDQEYAISTGEAWALRPGEAHYFREVAA
jgi:hypothetical protein